MGIVQHLQPHAVQQHRQKSPNAGDTRHVRWHKLHALERYPRSAAYAVRSAFLFLIKPLTRRAVRPIGPPFCFFIACAARYTRRGLVGHTYQIIATIAVAQSVIRSRPRDVIPAPGENFYLAIRMANAWIILLVSRIR